jgi:hypothetical protein
MSWSEAEDGYNVGTVSQVEWEAYCRAWEFCAERRATLQPHPWEVDDPAVYDLARDLCAAAAERLEREAVRRGWGFVPTHWGRAATA